jgi:hypothetical protein
LRVFVSGVIGGDARLAMNGTDTQMVEVGESVEVASGDQNCTVTVTGVDGDMVGLQGSCG